MALSAAVLSGLIKGDLLDDENVEDNASLQKLCDAIAASVVTHITSAAVVTTTVTGTSPSGAVTGAGEGSIS